MEQRGNHPNNIAIAIVPARFASERLRGKMLLPIGGKPLIVHTLERARAAERIDRVIAAVDDERLVTAVTNAGFEAVLTSLTHKSGSDRIAEIAEGLPADSLIINVQGDEPIVSPDTINRVVDALTTDPNADMATAIEPVISSDELLSPNVVKLVCDGDGYARYFSRSPIPFPRDATLKHGGELGRAVRADAQLLGLYRKHAGIYGYRRDYLMRFASLPRTELEKIESLEQLRALGDRARIRVVEAASPSIGVDTEDDYLRVKGIIESGVDVRPVREGEWEQVARAHVASWQGSFRGVVPTEYLDSLSIEQRRIAFEGRPETEGYEMLVAHHADKGLIGFVDCGQAKSVPSVDAEIFSFYLRPELQGRGIGSLLFYRVISRMISRGVFSLCLEALEASPYRRFYDKMGGRIVGRAMHDFGGRSLPTVIYCWEDIRSI